MSDMSGGVQFSRTDMQRAAAGFEELVGGLLEIVESLLGKIGGFTPFVDLRHLVEADKNFQAAWVPAEQALNLLLENLRRVLLSVPHAFKGVTEVVNRVDEAAEQEMLQVMPTTTHPSPTGHSGLHI
jgi:hypothetical protein